MQASIVFSGRSGVKTCRRRHAQKTDVRTPAGRRLLNRAFPSPFYRWTNKLEMYVVTSHIEHGREHPVQNCRLCIQSARTVICLEFLPNSVRHDDQCLLLLTFWCCRGVHLLHQ